MECIIHVREIEEDEDLIIEPCNNNLVLVQIYKRYVIHTSFNAKFAVLALNVRIMTEDSKTKIHILELREKDGLN